MRRFGESKGSQFLKSEHLANGQGGYKVAHVTIEDVAFHEFDETDTAYSVGFVSKQARLRLNRTNEAALLAMFGEPPAEGCTSDPEYAQRMTAHLRGKRVTIWVDPFVMFQGQRTAGLRLRPYEAPPRPAVETRAEEAFGSQAASTSLPHEADMRHTAQPSPGGEPPLPDSEFSPSSPPEPERAATGPMGDDIPFSPSRV